MSVRIQVTGSNNRAVRNARVFVKWKTGTSNATTNNSGIADLKCDGGTIEYIQVWDKNVSGSITVGNDEIVEVTYPG